MAGPPGPRLDQYFNRAIGRHTKQAEPKETTEFPNTRIAQAAASCCTDGEPNVITSTSAIYGLEHKVKIEGKLQLADDDHRRLVTAEGNQIAAADLALDREAEHFEVVLDGSIKARL